MVISTSDRLLYLRAVFFGRLVLTATLFTRNFGCLLSNFRTYNTELYYCSDNIQRNLPTLTVHTEQQDLMRIHFSDCEDKDQHGTKKEITSLCVNNSAYDLFIRHFRDTASPKV